MSRIANVKTAWQIGFRVHTVNLLGDIIVNLEASKKSGILFQPLNRFRVLLIDLAERATELNDPELNIIMMSLGLYDIDPKEVVGRIEEQIKLMHELSLSTDSPRTGEK
jgi:hypothetical protein